MIGDNNLRDDHMIGDVIDILCKIVKFPETCMIPFIGDNNATQLQKEL